MPKRAPTPPVDDPTKYYAVYYPYPLHANMEIPEERNAFLRWAASIVGNKDLVLSIAHRPTVCIPHSLVTQRLRLLAAVCKYRDSGNIGRIQGRAAPPWRTPLERVSGISGQCA